MPGHFKRGVTLSAKEEPVGEYLGVHQLGCFKYNGTHAISRPSRPWLGNFGGVGNITRNMGRSLNPCAFGDTPDDEWLQLSWHVFFDRGKHIYICDRHILTGLTRELLAEKGWVHGTPVIIDGDEYTVRSLTMGIRPIDGLYAGAFPEDNEWDRYVLNKVGFGAAPTPTEEDMGTTDLSSDALAMARPHNQSWWWCSVSTLGGPLWRGLPRNAPAEWVVRGGKTAQYMDKSRFNVDQFGFRPVLVRET